MLYVKMQFFHLKEEPISSSCKMLTNTSSEILLRFAIAMLMHSCKVTKALKGLGDSEIVISNCASGIRSYGFVIISYGLVIRLLDLHN